jgi:tetratricopeptide (TPR) repeat protein/TolB-like protein
MGDDAKSADVVETLDDILAHKIFAASPKAQDFLSYIITEALAGRADSINGTTIAQDVFQKDSNFDSLQDSVVRVTARRVRYMLQDYYAQCTSEPKVKISIPKGKYRPHFEYPQTQPIPQNTAEAEAKFVNTVTAPPSRKHKAFWAAGLLAVLIFIAVIGLFPSELGKNSAANIDEISSYPSIAIIPFTNQTDNADYGFLEKSLQKQMTEDLSRFSLIRPLSYDAAYETLLTKEVPVYDYAITGVILGVEPEIDLYIKLIDLKNTDVIFEDRIRRAQGQTQYFDTLFNIVSDLSGNFGGLEGVIIEERLQTIQDKIAKGTEALSDLTAFECNSLLDELIEKPSPELYKTIYNCLETLLQEDPKDGTLLASFGWINYVGATSYEPVLMARSVNPNINADVGFAMMEEAIQINPENYWAQQTISSIKLHKGDIAGALEHAEMAVQENPANPDNLTWLGSTLAQAGQWERAMRFAQEAIDRNPNPPSQYYYTFFLKALHDNDAEAMTAAANKLAEKGNYYANLYRYLAAIAENDQALIQALKPKIDEMAKRNKGDIMTVISSRMPSEDLKQKSKRLLMKGETLLSQLGG